MPAVPEADEGVRELYAGPADTFVERRKELAKQLRSDGQREAAAEVARLRRPSRAAWALNRAVAADPDGLPALVDVGRELEAVQRGEGGGAAELRRLAGQRREQIGRLADAAEAELGGEGAGLREKLQGTLEAASVDPAVAEALAAGTLAKEVDPPSGFGPLGMAPELRLVRDHNRAAEAEPEPEPEPDRRPELRAELAEVNDELRQATKRVAALERDLQGARRQADGLTRRRDAIETELRTLD